MKVSELKQSAYLKKDDVGNGVLVTIRSCDQQNVALPSEKADMRWALHFDEFEKPLILNPTNGALIQGILGSEDSDDWIGHKVVLFTDHSIMYAGRMVGGIRVRAPRNQPAAAAKPAPAAPRPAAAAPKPAPRPTPVPEPEPVDPGPEAEDPDSCPF